MTDDGFARRVRVALPDELARYVVEHGSIAARRGQPHRRRARRRRARGLADPRDAGADHPRRARAGRAVNVEFDVIARYVERLATIQQMTAKTEQRTRRPFATIEEALEDIRAGRMVVVCDDEDRENEGDLVMAAQFATPEAINFMAKEGRGLICLALTPERCDELGLDLMAAKNESPLETAFTVSIEAARASPPASRPHDRAHTIQVAIDPGTGARGPGPARPRLPAEGQGRRRARAHRPDRGQRRPRAARRPEPGRRDLRDHERGRDDGPRRPTSSPTASAHGLKMITVADLIAYRRKTEKLVERVVSTRLPTAFGEFRAVGYRSLVDDKHHVAMVKGDVDGARTSWSASTRECLTGDVFHSLRCDCGEQLEAALAMIERGGPRRPALPLPGGPRDRPAQQAARLQAPGGGPRHRRRQPRARAAGRPARLRDRRPDPRRPRAAQHPHPDQQPEEDHRARGLRALASPSRSRSQASPNPHNEAYLQTKRDKMGHTLHHQGLPLDEEMIHDEQRCRDAEAADAARMADATATRSASRTFYEDLAERWSTAPTPRLRRGRVAADVGRTSSRSRAPSSCRSRRSSAPSPAASPGSPASAS